MTYSQSVTVAVCVTYIVSGYFPSPPSTDASTRCLEQCHKSVQCFSRYLLALSPLSLHFAIYPESESDRDAFSHSNRTVRCCRLRRA